MNTINIPVGTSNFAEIRRKGSYFIDKSSLIEQLLKTQSTKVTLITRPRRFGKTLGMSMLSEFFDIQKNSRALFEGLSVMKNKGLCRQWMNQYPTLFLSFRSVDGLNFSGAYAQLASVIAELYKKHIYLTESEGIQPLDKEQFHRTAAEKADLKGIKNSLLKLTQLMELHYQKSVILIIDEYDVPLAKASEKGYYREMQDAIKGVMQVIKDNNSLEFAVITGCLQIAKESIFTGTNNFVSDTISDTQLNEYFGFTQDEVNRLLADTGLAPYAEEVREWYDGYHFGDFDVYCPWDVMNHVQNLLLNPDSKPKNFWENTSDNSIIRTFLKRTDFDINDKFETLLAFLTGLFSNAGYRVESNYENGLGRSDLVVKDRRNRRAVVLEAKRTYYEDQMENACEEALSQIREKQYAEKVERDGYKKAGRLGIAFFQKKCLVKKG